MHNGRVFKTQMIEQIDTMPDHLFITMVGAFTMFSYLLDRLGGGENPRSEEEPDTDKSALRRRFWLIAHADRDIQRYREVRDIHGKVFLTFLEGAGFMYGKAGLSRKSQSVLRLAEYLKTNGLHDMAEFTQEETKN